MNGRLVLAIISTCIEEAVIAGVVLWLLPRLNVRIPVWVLAIIMIAWAGYAVLTHRLGSRALNTKRPIGMENMLGCTGEVVRPLSPEGLVNIRGELWTARSENGEIPEGKEIEVVSQQKLKLVVREVGRS